MAKSFENNIHFRTWNFRQLFVAICCSGWKLLTKRSKMSKWIYFKKFSFFELHFDDCILTSKNWDGKCTSEFRAAQTKPGWTLIFFGYSVISIVLSTFTWSQNDTYIYNSFSKFAAFCKYFSSHGADCNQKFSKIDCFAVIDVQQKIRRNLLFQTD